MPNGFSGTDDEWERMEAPLKAVEDVLAEFATAHGMQMTKNYHGWPERSLTWGTGIRKLIQLYAAESDKPTFNIWPCASQDRGLSRFWKREFLIEKKPFETFAVRLPELLEEARIKVNSWTEEQLEFATKVAG
jgi:hypothetical protein